MDYIIKECTKGDEEYICDKLVEYNLSQVSAKQEVLFYNINRKIVDQNQNIIAGCIAKMYCWNVMYIDILWVDERYRNTGVGSRLLKHVEDVARDKGCFMVHLDTFDFQAKDFYLKYGYEIFGELKNCPQNHSRFYLQKRL